MFHVNPLPSREFTWNIKSFFLWKTMKKYLWMSPGAVVIGALRVNKGRPITFCTTALCNELFIYSTFRNVRLASNISLKSGNNSSRDLQRPTKKHLTFCSWNLPFWNPNGDSSSNPERWGSPLKDTTMRLVWNCWPYKYRTKQNNKQLYCPPSTWAYVAHQST